MAEFDVLIQGGTVVDGSRTPRYMGDVGIKDGKIAKIAKKTAKYGMFDTYEQFQALWS